MITLSKDQARTLIEVIEELVSYVSNGADLLPDLNDLQNELNSVFSEDEYDSNAYSNFKSKVELNYIPEAYLVMSNFGGISIMIDPEDNDYLYYKYYDEDPVRTEIDYIFDEKNNNLGLIPVFTIGADEVFRIDEFMKIDY